MYASHMLRQKHNYEAKSKQIQKTKSFTENATDSKSEKTNTKNITWLSNRKVVVGLWMVKLFSSPLDFISTKHSGYLMFSFLDVLKLTYFHNHSHVTTWQCLTRWVGDTLQTNRDALLHSFIGNNRSKLQYSELHLQSLRHMATGATKHHDKQILNAGNKSVIIPQWNKL